MASGQSWRMTSGAESMLTIQTILCENLPFTMAQGLSLLTVPNSPHRGWFSAIADGVPPSGAPDDLTYAVALRDEEFDIVPVAWASMYVFDGTPCLDGFVHGDMRGRRLASACAAVLVNSVNNPIAEVGVFSDEFEAIAKWLRCATIIRYRRTDDGWTKRDVTA